MARGCAPNCSPIASPCKVRRKGRSASRSHCRRPWATRKRRLLSEPESRGTDRRVAGKKPFNNPFKGVKLPPKDEPPKAPAPPPKPAPPPPARREGLTDDELWGLAIDGAAPLEDRKERIRPGPQPQAVVPAQLDPEIEAYEELRALVRGEAPFDLVDSDEFIEGSVHGLDPRVVRRLRKGEFAVQGHVDLHGMTRSEEHTSELQ